LAAVITQCEVAKLKTGADDPMITRLDGVIATSEKSATLIRRLLSFSRRQPFKPKVIELNSAVEELTKMVSRLIGDDIQLNIFCDSGPNNVLMDPAHVEQILLNLVLNSRDALPSGGIIEIHVNGAAQDDCVSLRVTDDGFGIPEDILEKIFEPFFTTKSEGHNSGIGLTTVHNIVTQNGGEISVSNPAHGGTIFTILLPRTEQVLIETNSGKISPIKCRSKQSGILFVDDNAELRKSTSEILELLGYHVWTAPDGNAALQAYDELRNSVSLLITDVVMPTLGGIALASHLREERPNLPVIFISGQGIEALGGGPTDDSHTVFLAKPFTVTQLAAAIEDALPYT
jgi:two-component system cell cycle sensor histidine kinase/response regulator CckA